MKTNILKINQNSSEEFKKGKIFNDVFGACLSASCLQGEAETIASRVCNQVEAWANQFSEITEDDLKEKLYLVWKTTNQMQLTYTKTKH